MRLGGPRPPEVPAPGRSTLASSATAAALFQALVSSGAGLQARGPGPWGRRLYLRGEGLVSPGQVILFYYFNFLLRKKESGFWFLGGGGRREVVSAVERPQGLTWTAF